jgi:cytochrome c5
MNEAPNDHAVLERHEGPIRNPKQLIVAVLASFIVPIFVIVLLTQFVTSAKKPAAGNERSLEKDGVAARITPVAKLEWKDMSGPRTLKTGEEVYKAQCSTCHAAGLALSPKLGDATAWAPRIANGYDKLLASALKGKGAMPAQAGGDYDEVEVGRAVAYMANSGGAKFEEPKAPVAAVKTAETAAAVAAPAAAAVAVAAAAPAAAPAPAKAEKVATVNGEAVYKQVCIACHAAGVAGSPKTGDKAAWAPRIATGVDALTQAVIKGKGAMPPKGGSAASEAEIKAAVEYLVAQAK